MKQLLSQYRGLKKEIYILFVGKLVTAMGSFVWPMMTFLLTAKLGFSDGVATLIIATGGAASLPMALLGGKLADRFPRKNIIILFDCLTVALYVLAFRMPIGYPTVAVIFFAALFQTLERPAYDALNADYSTTKQRERAFPCPIWASIWAMCSGLRYPAFSSPGIPTWRFCSTAQPSSFPRC